MRVAVRGLPTAYFTPTYRMLSEVWRSLKSTLGYVTKTSNEEAHRIELLSGGVIECWSLTNADTVRGRKYARIVVDEAALIQDADIWPAVLRPLLTDYKGSALFLSTPRGKNWFWQLYSLGSDPLKREWRSFHYPTTANPYIDPAEVEAARQMLPERIFRQEYLAEFMDDAGSVFRGVSKVCTALPLDGPPADHRVLAGLDFGRYQDFSVVSVIDATTKTQIYLDRFNQIDWTFQRERIKAICQRFNVETLVAEANSIGEPNIEALQRMGVPVEAFYTTVQSKAPLIESYALAIEQGEITLLNDPVQIAELESYGMERLPSGRFTYSAPPGSHDDIVVAGALSWYAVEHYRRFGGIHV